MSLTKFLLLSLIVFLNLFSIYTKIQNITIMKCMENEYDKKIEFTFLIACFFKTLYSFFFIIRKNYYHYFIYGFIPNIIGMVIMESIFIENQSICFHELKSFMKSYMILAIIHMSEIAFYLNKFMD